MNIHLVGSYPSDDINGLVAVFLEDIAGQPLPQAAEFRLAEIRQAVAEGRATDDMVLDIIRLVPVH